MGVQWGFMKFKADAQTCYNEIQTLGETYTPEQVLDLARNPKTELHKCFDWNDTTAAEKWRKQQARFVCTSLVVTVEKSDGVETSYRVIQHDKEDGAYRPVTLTVRDDDQYGRLLRQAKAELASFRKRYKSITELEGVIDEIEAVLFD